MIIRTSLLAGAFLLMLLIFGTTSCKKCKLSEGNQNTGLIIEDAIIYPSSGYMATGPYQTMNITAGHYYSNNFEVSFDGGATRVPVDYSQYSILASGVEVDCEAAINKDVSYDSNLDVYTYRISGESCSSCKSDGYHLDNFVLVPAIPASTTVVYDVDVAQK